MDCFHPAMQQALIFFGANMQFTTNAAYPHPDSDIDSEPPPWPLDEAIRHAIKIMRNPNADQFTRNAAATELDVAWTYHKE